MTTGNNWQPTDLRRLESTDKALDGQGFSVYMVNISGGLTKDQEPVGFTVAGPSSLPSPDELWDEFRSRHIGHMTTADVKKFLEFMKFSGYVQIETNIMMGLRYGQ